jgi:two-component system NtrC family sensor kinase
MWHADLQCRSRAGLTIDNAGDKPSRGDLRELYRRGRRSMTNEHTGGSIRDVCARIRAMDPTLPGGVQLEHLARELEVLDVRYAGERAQAVVDAKRRLADLEELHNANRLVTVGTLTAGIAHELGTPLGVVLARAQMIVADEVDIIEARSDAEEIIRQVKRMTQMCREVLDFSRPRPPTRDRVDVVHIVRQMIGLLVPEARKRGAKLVLGADPPPTLVLGDPSKLMQIITNLTINATQAMPNGGTVTLAVEKKRVEPPAVEQLPDAEYVCIHVQDTGTGIRSADLGHIFDTFFTTKKSEGTGIGLAVSSRIAREHDGWIGVITQEGQGSTFTVYLPPLVPTA